MVIPKSPESEKWELMQAAESTKSLDFIRLTALELPEPNPLADPIMVSMREKAN